MATGSANSVGLDNRAELGLLGIPVVSRWTVAVVKYYILKDRKPTPCTMMQWARWFGGKDRVVAKSTVCGFRVSTIFLGLEHCGGIWETMVFKGPVIDAVDAGGLDMDRCFGTWEQAEEMHRRMCERIEGAMGESKEKTNGKAES